MLINSFLNENKRPHFGRAIPQKPSEINPARQVRWNRYFLATGTRYAMEDRCSQGIDNVHLALLLTGHNQPRFIGVLHNAEIAGWSGMLLLHCIGAEVEVIAEDAGEKGGVIFIIESMVHHSME